MRGYKTGWEQRAGIAPLCITPLLVKLGCAALIIFLGLEENFLRQGLVLLPAYFAEGVLISYLVCMVVKGQVISGDLKTVKPYQNDIMAGVLVYVLMKLVLSFVAASLLNGAIAAQEQGTVDTPETSGSAFMAVIFLIVFSIWAFRFMWLYIPVVMGVPVLSFLRRVRSFSSSFPMLGCWFMCFIPIGIVMLLVSKILLGIFPQGDELSQEFSLLLTIVQSVLELVIAIVSSIAMTYGFQQIMDTKKG